MRIDKEGVLEEKGGPNEHFVQLRTRSEYGRSIGGGRIFLERICSNRNRIRKTHRELLLNFETRFGITEATIRRDI